MCSFLMLEIKSYVSLKNESFPFFLDEGTFQGIAHKGGGALTDLDFFWGGDLGKKGWGQYFRVGLIPWKTLCHKKTQREQMF